MAIVGSIKDQSTYLFLSITKYKESIMDAGRGGRAKACANSGMY